VQSRRSFGVFGSTALQGTDYLRPDAVARVMDTLRFLADSARYAYQMGFYVPESELDGTVHKLAVAVAANPGLELRYRDRYTASSFPTAPPATPPSTNDEPAPVVSPDQVGIDARVDSVSGAPKQMRLMLDLAPDTVTGTADRSVLVEVTFTQTDALGKQLAKVSETLRITAPESPNELIPYSRILKRSDYAVLPSHRNPRQGNQPRRAPHDSNAVTLERLAIMTGCALVTAQTRTTPSAKKLNRRMTGILPQNRRSPARTRCNSAHSYILKMASGNPPAQLEASPPSGQLGRDPNILVIVKGREVRIFGREHLHEIVQAVRSAFKRQDTEIRN